MTETHLLAQTDLEAIVRVHTMAFPTSALTRLGTEAVYRYYEWLIVGPHDSANIGAFNGSHLVGFCFGGIFRGAMGGFLERNRLFLIRMVITRPWLLTNPLFRERAVFAVKYARRWRRARKSKPDPVNFFQSFVPKRTFGILSIAVHPEHQGKGIAQTMMEREERVAMERGFREMNLTVQPTNNRAIRFYEKMGWKRDMRGSKWTGSMTKAIGDTVPPSTNAGEVASA